MNRTIPFFSVVIPCYNCEKIILPTLKSLNTQKFRDFEVVFVNDGSTDNTIDILNSFQFDGIKKVISQENLGLGAARNTGIRNSVGFYVSLLDHDDIWEPEKLLVIYKILNDGKYDLVCHNEAVLNNHGETLRINKYGPFKTFYELYFNYNCLSPSAVTISMTTFQKVGYFTEDESLWGVEDYDMWLRISLEKLKFKYVNQVLGSYIMHGSNMSKAYRLYASIEQLMINNISNLDTTKNSVNKMIKVKFRNYYFQKIKHAIIKFYGFEVLRIFLQLLRCLFPARYCVAHLCRMSTKP